MTFQMPMNFKYTRQGPDGWKFYGTPGTPATTMDAIMQGLRTSTLRKGLSRGLEPGSNVLFTDNDGRRQPAIVTGKRMVDPSMAEELSRTERWTPEFLRWYMGQNGLDNGRMEQLLYQLPSQGVIATPRMAGDALIAAAAAPTGPIWAFGGARATPPDVLELISQIGKKHAESGGRIVHGGAPGADRAASRLVSNPEALSILLPGPNDPRGPDPQYAGGRVFDATQLPTWERAHAIARQYEDPYRPGGRNYNARNVMVLLGPGLDAPREKLVVWSPGAQAIGGTGHAIRTAEGHGIPVRNLADPAIRAAAEQWLRA